MVDFFLKQEIISEDMLLHQYNVKELYYDDIRKHMQPYLSGKLAQELLINKKLDSKCCLTVKDIKKNPEPMRIMMKLK